MSPSAHNKASLGISSAPEHTTIPKSGQPLSPHLSLPLGNPDDPENEQILLVLCVITLAICMKEG